MLGQVLVQMSVQVEDALEKNVSRGTKSPGKDNVAKWWLQLNAWRGEHGTKP